MVELESISTGLLAPISGRDAMEISAQEEGMVHEEPIRIFTSCSPEKVHATLSQLCSEAKEIVKDLGLGGL